MRFSSECFCRGFPHHVGMMATLKRTVVEDELIKAERLFSQCFSLIDIRSQSAIKVLNNATATMC